ncbi:MAG TPA: hypothetical protein VFD30_05700 [Terriglobia bacterium]|nr:hypothetical protein [Terriglobia bacterium]
MKRFRISGSCFVFLVAALSAMLWGAGKQVTVNGYVIDSSCVFTKNLSEPISTDCAVECAKAGSPLVILEDGGKVYWPISGTMPAEGQNGKLMPFAGKRVTVAGTVYQKGGSSAIVIDKIQGAP